MPDDQSMTAAPDRLSEPFAGGFYAGRIRVNEQVYALIVAPRTEGDHAPIKWNGSNEVVDGATSFFDGPANTKAMAAAGSKLATWARDLRIGGFDDWYLPSRDELELCYRAFKPGTYSNSGWSGDNPSSVPVGYAYGPDAPAQTSNEAFRNGGADAFQENWYWSSTQYLCAAEYAWCQNCLTGSQDILHEDYERRARAVRRVKI